MQLSLLVCLLNYIPLQSSWCLLQCHQASVTGRRCRSYNNTNTMLFPLLPERQSKALVLLRLSVLIKLPAVPGAWVHQALCGGIVSRGKDLEDAAADRKLFCLAKADVRPQGSLRFRMLWTWLFVRRIGLCALYRYGGVITIGDVLWRVFTWAFVHTGTVLKQWWENVGWLSVSGELK